MMLDLEEQVRQLISNGKTKEALDLITPYSDQAILLRSRLSNLQRNNNMGMIDYSEYSRELSRINFSIMSLLDSDDIELPKNVSYQSSQKSISSPVNNAPFSLKNRFKPKVFVSYAHDDSAALKEMEEMLKVLKRNGTIDIWTDSEILPGQNWNNAIKDSLMNADIILLLISASFLNSDYIWRHEMQLALQKSKEGRAITIPIILRPCLWKEVDDLAKLQALPINDEGRLLPIVKWEDRDEAWMKVAEGLKKVIEKMKD